MASSKSLDDKHQKILRQLLLEPDNKKCFDCQNKGPVYVCLNFNTFVCTTCSGIHREFNHRVKSISMATFKPEEIKALQAGGNALARKQWLARWHPDDFPEPDSSDQARIRQFMKLKYHDKRWADNGRGDPRDRDHRDHRDAPAPGQGFRDLPRETSARDRSNSRGESFHAPPSRNDSVPQIKPLEQILGSNIPPIQFNNPQKQATQAPPPVQAPGASKQAELVAWDTPTKATSSAANDLNDLFSTPTPEQQAQYQQNQAQYQQQQQQAAYQQQQRNIMAQFGQTNPNAGAFFGPPAGQMHPNAGMFGPPPGAQQGGWGAPQQQQGMFNPNAFVPQQQQQQGGNFFQQPQQQPFGATPQQPFGGQPQQPFGGAPQQPFGAAPQPFGGAPGGPFGGASPQAPFGTPNIQPPSPQPFGQGYPPTAPSPTFGGPAGQTLQPQGQKQPGFGTSPSGPGPNFGGLQPQQPQQPQQPAAPAKPDIFAALSPLNAGANFGGPKPADKRLSQNLGGGPAMSSSTGLHGPGMNGMNGSSTLHPNGSNTAANPFGGAPSPQASQPLKPAGGQQDLFGGGDLFGAAPTPTPQAQKPQQPQQQQQQQQQQDFFGGGSGGFGGAPSPSPQPQQPAHQQAQQDFFGGGSGGFGAPQKPQQPQQPAQQDFFGGGGFGAPQQQQHQPQQQSQQDFFGGGSGGFGAPQQPQQQQQQKPPQHQSQQDFFGGGGGGFGASPQQPSPNFQQQSQQQQQQQQQANPFGQQPPSAFSPFGGQPQPQQQQANPFGAQSFQQQQQPTAQAADPFNPFAF